MTVSATTARRRKAAPPIHSRNRHSPSSADLPRLVTSPPSHHRRKHEDKLPVFHPDMQTARLLAVKNGARTLPDICFEVTSTGQAPESRLHLQSRGLENCQHGVV